MEEQYQAMEIVRFDAEQQDDGVIGDCESKGSSDESMYSMDDYASDGSKDNNGMEHEFYEPPCNEEGNQLENRWDDGIELAIGKEFNNKKEVQAFMERGAHKGSFAFYTIKSDKVRYMLKCRLWKKGCKWYFHAAKVNRSYCFRVAVYQKTHTCSRTSATESSENRNCATQGLVASLLKEDYPGLLQLPSAKALMGLVQRKYGVAPSYSTCWRGRNEAINEVRGNAEEGYKRLYSYLYMLEAVNPGTKTSVKLDELGRFLFLFIALGACVEGFSSMRQVLIVDGTFLKCGYGGMLLIATAQDPNRHTYPVAFAVVDSENDASWNWFFETLKTVIPDSDDLVFVSDRNTSLINAVKVVYKKATHGFCIYHLSQNVKLKVSHTNINVVAEKFWEIAHIYNENEFERRYADFRAIYPQTIVSR